MRRNSASQIWSWRGHKLSERRLCRTNPTSTFFNVTLGHQDSLRGWRMSEIDAGLTLTLLHSPDVSWRNEHRSKATSATPHGAVRQQRQSWSGCRNAYPVARARQSRLQLTQHDCWSRPLNLVFVLLRFENGKNMGVFRIDHEHGFRAKRRDIKKRTNFCRV